MIYQTKLIGFLLLLLSAGIAAGSVTATGFRDEAPIRIVKVTIGKGAYNQYVRAIRKFADSYAFAIRVSHSSPKPDDILVQLWRSDVRIIGANSSEVGARDTTFDIVLFNNCGCDVPVPPTTINRLVFGLKGTVGQIQGATFSERPE
jgi:hypothetical protein